MNPEFKRNLWLEISPARLAIMPAVLTLIGLLVVALNQDDPYNSLFVAFSALFVALAAGWGSVRVVSSINDEVTERTWDQQRLSALTPWDMAWGKLLGSTAYAWYGGLLCVLVALVSAAPVPDFWSRSVWLMTGMAGTVALHAWLMASRLHTLDVRTEKSSGMAGRLFGLVLVMQLMPAVFWVLRDPRSPDGQTLGNWWGLGMPLPLQSLLVLLLMLALGLLALWRSMGKQLMVRSVPWAWVVGVLGIGWVVAGFAPPSGGGPSLWMTLAGTALVATYGALFTESNNRLTWQAVLYHQAHSPTRRLWQALPLWPLSWALAAVCLVAHALTGSGSAGTPLPALNGLMWMALLHTLRDCGVYHFFAFRHSTRKPAAITLVSIFVLGVVLPGLVATVSPDLAVWAEPLFGMQALAQGQESLGTAAWLSMGLHLVVVATLVVWRWSATAPRQLGAA